MAGTSIATFTQAAQQAQQWFNELSDDLDWTDRRAYHLLRSVLHALRDWLPQQEMIDLASHLPTLIRGIFFDGWRPLATPVAGRKKELFIARIQDDFSDGILNDPNAAVAAVFRLLDRHISDGQIADIRHSLKKPLRELWPAD
jgi:uncharacterized protein (DUF2267 family)